MVCQHLPRLRLAIDRLPVNHRLCYRLGMGVSAERYEGLDALRGVAALAVVAYHAPHLFGAATPPSAYLAVDFFFCLSGVVIAKAFGARIDAGMPVRTALTLRLRRLLPLYLLALAFAAALSAIKVTAGHPLTAADVAALAMNAFALPSIFTMALFPLNVAAWSLTYELLANAVMFLLWRRLSILLLWAVMAMSGSALVWGGLSHGSLETGIGWDTAPLALARVSFSFFAGVLLFRLKLKTPRLSPWLLLAILACVFWTDGPAVFDVAVAVVLVPLIVGLGVSARGNAALTALGDLSYAVYILHIPLLRWFTAGLEAAGTEVRPGPLAAIFLVLLVVACCLAGRAWDRPVRSLLSDLVVRQRRATSSDRRARIV